MIRFLNAFRLRTLKSQLADLDIAVNDLAEKIAANDETEEELNIYESLVDQHYLKQAAIKEMEKGNG